MTNKNIIGAAVGVIAGVAGIGLSICMGLDTKKPRTRTIIVETGDNVEMYEVMYDGDQLNVIKKIL